MSERPILLVPGSLRAGAYSTRVLRIAASLLPDGLPVEFADLVRALPHYDADLDGEGETEAVRIVRQRVATSAGLIVATPEYNGTIPGGLKNAFDWLTRPFRAHSLIDKPLAVIGTSPGPKGAIGAVTWTRTTLGLLGASVVGEPVAIGDVATQLDGSGELAPEALDQMVALIGAFVAAVHADDNATQATA